MMGVKLIIPRNECVRKSSSYAGTSNWNDLNLELRSLENKSFKTQIKEKIKTGEIPVFC